MTTFSMTGKHVAITGASSGFGHHFAGVLSAAGAKVTLGARREDKLSQRVAELTDAGHSACAATLDVREPDSIKNFFDQAESTFGPVDVLINNAGVESGAKTYAMIDEEDWDFVMDTNLKSAWRMSKQFTERLQAHKLKSGNIVMVSSITDRRTIKGQFPYAISKAAMTRMTEVMALEASRYGIRVNALAPGYIPTDVSTLVINAPNVDEFVKGIPMRRFGDFADLDGPILLLASDASSYMTGSVVTVDGGHVCGSL